MIELSIKERSRQPVFGLREGYFIIAHCECWKTRRSCTAYNIVEDCYQIETYMDRGSWTNFPAL